MWIIAKKRDSGSKVNSCPLSSHEIDGVRKEKERLTASKLKKSPENERKEESMLVIMLQISELPS